jgi:carboxylate-amine ligase
VTDHDKRLGLFEGYGVELEYMIVDAETLDVRPIADQLLAAEAGSIVSDVELGPVAWSNELVLHVIELKTNGPAKSLRGLAAQFQESVMRINAHLAKFGARLMPSAMHPWMNPARETKLWPHDYNAVYEAFDRIFGCEGHGWSNLQSVHVNLPFANDEEFARLHAAIRVLLPIMPALSASSPFADRHATDSLDFRLETYRTNAARIPSISGLVIPEPVFSEADYDREIFQRIYADIAPHDPEGILQDEFLNARGAIARFSRGAIEIRVLDIAECPAADLAVVGAIVAALKGLASERWSTLAAQQSVATEPLAALLRSVARDAERATVAWPEYAAMFGIQSAEPITAGDVWRHLVAQASVEDEMDDASRAALEVILQRGPLARRILNATGGDAATARLPEVYRQLCDDLSAGRMFNAHV